MLQLTITRVQEDVDDEGPRRRPGAGGAFVRALGSLDALFIGFGAMIGFGWSTLTGGWIDSAGTVGALLAMICGGIPMALVGLVYSELVAAMPQTGASTTTSCAAWAPEPR